MYTELPVLSRCCFCAPLRHGLIVWAYLKLVLYIIIFGFSLVWLSGFGIFIFFSEYAIIILLLMASAILFVFFEIIFNFVLIIGIHKKHTTLLRLYYRYGIVYNILLTILGILIIAFVLSTTSQSLEDSDTLHFIVIFSTICFLFIVQHVYLLLLVRSEIIKLKPSGQFQFVNHTADPKCMMHTDFSTTIEKKDLSTKILS